MDGPSRASRQQPQPQIPSWLLLRFAVRQGNLARQGGEPMARKKTGAATHRAEMRERLFPGAVAWTGEGSGWMKAYRSLPLVLGLMKYLSKGKDPGPVYIELLSKHISDGIIQMGVPADHAYSAGYWGTRAERTWNERMDVLLELGFIQAQAKGRRRYGYVLLVPPEIAVNALVHKNKPVPAEWLEAYETARHEAKETRYDGSESKTST